MMLHHRFHTCTEGISRANGSCRKRGKGVLGNAGCYLGGGTNRSFKPLATASARFETWSFS
ncbi:MAG: hypothetical protein HW407_1815 [Bacteroidetes bacterium]|nr:hypothetical protein [Bacteroidota bacterium]